MHHPETLSKTIIKCHQTSSKHIQKHQTTSNIFKHHQTTSSKKSQTPLNINNIIKKSSNTLKNQQHHQNILKHLKNHEATSNKSSNIIKHPPGKRRQRTSFQWPNKDSPLEASEALNSRCNEVALFDVSQGLIKKLLEGVLMGCCYWGC